MDPLNLTERNNAIKKFMAVNGILLLLAMLAVYFFCSIPISIIRSNLQDCENTEAKQKKLNDTVSNITYNVSNLLKSDEQLSNTKNVETTSAILSNKEEYETNVRDGLMIIKRDTSSSLPPVVKVSSLNYIKLLDAFMHSRATINSLNTTLKDNGIDAVRIEKLDAENLRLQSKIDNQNILIATLSAGAAAGGGGGGGGGADAEALKASIKKMQAENELLEKKAKECKDAIDKLKGISQPAVSAGPGEDTKKGDGSFEAADYLYQLAAKSTEGVTKKQAYLFGARAILTKLKDTYQNKEAVKKKMLEIDVLFRQITNM